MTYVILQPHSNTNPSAQYRVVDSDKWVEHVNGKRQSYPVAKSCKDYQEAKEARDELNQFISMNE